ncbi:MAG TPA: hypothetical protein VGR14_05780 [Verrucomicrobiae bacterium]|jgi:hypothetical protein|nr:hypothetical protein [Verrucomicrobiae bacterium]
MPLKKVICQAALIPSGRALILWLAVLSLLTVPLRAELRFDAFLGYDDILPERSWFPITCEIFNDGPAFNAVVEVTARDYGEGQTRRFMLDLPTNTRKRITIPVFATSGNWNVRLLDERGRPRSEQSLSPRRMMKNNLPLIAALSRTVAGVPVLPESPAWLNDDSKYSVARLQTSLFPDNPLALEGIDTLYISSQKAADLSVGQVNALVAWLQRGGHLVIGVEQLTDVNGTPWLHELMPCTLSAIVNVSAHQSLLEWAHSAVVLPDTTDQNRPRGQQRSQSPPTSINAADTAADDAQFDATAMQVATGQLRDGKVLIGGAAEPLAIDAVRGRGRITVLTFSPEREPFVSWKNRTWFWAKLADVKSDAFLNPNAMVVANRLSSDGIFRAMIETKQVRKLPLGWLLALLVAYLVVIGPLDQYWLKKINRQMLTWVTFPCYVVFFSALIYFIGFHLRAGELEWNELNVVDILPDSDRAVLRGQTYVSIYSPNNAHYQMAGSQKFASLRGEYLGNFGGNQEGSRATVDQTGNNFHADTFVPVWTSELFVSDWVQPSPLPLEMTVRPANNGWEVTVNNGLDHPLPALHAVLDGRIYTMGEIPASQSKTFTLKTGQGTLVSDMARQYGDRFRTAVGNLRSSFGNNVNPITDVPQASLAASFLTYVNMGGQQTWNNFTGPSNLDLSRFSGEGYAILLAWDTGHSPSDLNQFTPKRYHSDTLYRLVVPVKM